MPYRVEFTLRIATTDECNHPMAMIAGYLVDTASAVMDVKPVSRGWTPIHDDLTDASVGKWRMSISEEPGVEEEESNG